MKLLLEGDGDVVKHKLIHNLEKEGQQGEKDLENENI